MRSISPTTDFIKYNIIGRLLACIKLLLIIALVKVLFVLELISQILIVPTLIQGFRRLIVGLVGRLVLACCGYFWIESMTINLKKRKQSTANQGRKLIIANHTSYIDFLYFGFRYAPVFLLATPKGKVQPVSLFQGIFDSEQPTFGDDLMDLAEYINHHNSAVPIVLFPEGTMSNGRGVLKFLPVFKNFDSIKVKIDLKVIGIK